MNAYFLTSGITCSQVRPVRVGGIIQSARQLQIWDSCQSLIVCAHNLEQAQKRFAAWLCQPAEGENPVEAKIRKMVAAPFMEQLLTESGREPMDWIQISQRVEATLQRGEADNFEQGYWADVNQLIPPGQLSSHVELLERNLPEDIRSGLNWSAERQFFFIVSVLSPPAPPAEPAYEMESDQADPDEVRDGIADESGPAELDIAIAALPELKNREVAGLVQARNSVVAAWLWRRFAADTKYAAHDISIHPWCGVALPDEEEKFPGGPG